MKKIFTLLSVLIFSQLSAQFSENFESSLTSLTSNCWTSEQVNYSTTASDVINGNASAYTNPPTSGAGERTLATPFLDMLSSTVTISFKYKVSSKINGQSTRTIRVGILDKTGVFTQLDLVTLNNSTATTIFTYNKTFTLTTPGVYRLGLRLGGATGDGNSRLIFDDLYVSASAHYGPTSYCNTGAVAVNDSYSIPFPSPTSGNLFANDNIPADGDTYASILVADSTKGQLVVNSNGTFTFTPSASFLGGVVTFTYQINDYGYTPLVSNIATVTLSFGNVSLLPMHIQQFTASSANNKVILNWSVDENEAGRYFEIQRSVDGQLFQVAGIVTANEKAGVQKYSFNEVFSGKNTYYRVRMVNASHAEVLSPVKLVKAGTTANELVINGNPVSSKLQFIVTSAAKTTSSVSVYTMTGVKVYTESVELAAGSNRMTVDMNSEAPGGYILEVSTNGVRSVSRFVKQ